MSWLNIAAELVRGAMSARQALPPRGQESLPEDVAGLTELVQRYRSEVDRGFDALTQAMEEQNERQLRALRAQRLWNYGLLAAVVVMAVVLVVVASGGR